MKERATPGSRTGNQFASSEQETPVSVFAAKESVYERPFTWCYSPRPHSLRGYVGAFLVLNGQVSLSVGDEGLFPQDCVNGALLGLPATLSKGVYCMTATVMEDAELGFLPSQVLESLMQTNPDVSRALLKLLSEKTLAIQQVHKTLLHAQKERSRQVSSILNRVTLHL